MPRSAHFNATVKDGRLAWSDPGRAAGFLAKCAGKRLKVTVELEERSHTQSQRGWYRAAIVPEVAAFLSEAKGYVISNEQAHELLKSAFIGTVAIEVNGVRVDVPVSTNTLDPGKFADYCTAILAHFAGLGLEIPTPEDYWSRKPGRSEVA